MALRGIEVLTLATWFGAFVVGLGHADTPLTLPQNEGASIADPNQPLVVVPATGLRAFFTWQVPERIRSDRYDTETASYDPSYVNPSLWGVMFNGCLSEPENTSTPIKSYIWEIRQITNPPQPTALSRRFETDKCETWAFGDPSSDDEGDAGTSPPLPTDETITVQPGTVQPGLAATTIFRPPFRRTMAGDRFGAWDELSPEDPAIPEDDTEEDHAKMPAFPSLGAYEVKLTVRDSINRTAEFVQTVILRDYLIVVIGDSFTAGQGNPDWAGQASGYPLWIFSDLVDSISPDFGPCRSTKAVALYLSQQESGARVSMDYDPKWVEERAWRSYNSAHVRAAKRIEIADPHTSVTLLTFASSGAGVDDLVSHGQRRFQRQKLDCSEFSEDCGQIREVQEAVGDRTIDALIMSIGGNDAGFAAVLKKMITGDFDGSSAERDAKERIEAMGLQYKKVGDALKQKLKIRDTFITGYPTDLFSTSSGATGGGCGIFESHNGLTSSASVEEAVAARELGEQLNAQIEAASFEYGWHFVPTYDLFLTHGYCSSAGSYFRGAEASCLMQGDTEGTMHPNEEGHGLAALRLEEELFQWLPSGRNDPVNNEVLLTPTDGN